MQLLWFHAINAVAYLFQPLYSAVTESKTFKKAAAQVQHPPFASGSRADLPRFVLF
jgi:hypothetical protein